MSQAEMLEFLLGQHGSKCQGLTINLMT